MAELVLSAFGDLTSDHVRLAKDPQLTAGPNDVLLRMTAAPINPVDSLVSNGWYAVSRPVGSRLGAEGVGRVVEVGSEVDTALVGRLVVTVTVYHGTWADQIVVPANNVVVVPDGIDATQLATLVINPATAYLMLNDFVHLRPGDWVLQTLGNSALARHATALARLAGVRMLSVVRSETAAASAESDVVLVDGPDLGERVTAAIGGRVARLVLDGVGGATPGVLAGALEPGGTLVGYASATLTLPAVPAPTLLFGNLALRGFWIGRWYAEASHAEHERVLNHLAALVRDGVLSTKVDSTFRLDQYEEALARNASPNRDGKVLFTFDD